jgi:hypothetical protein
VSDLHELSIETRQDAQIERPRRLRVLKGAHAAFNQEHSAIPCIVRDLSETGAKLEFDQGWIVPSTFILFVEIDGYKVQCEKIWSCGKLCGVRFIGPKIPTSVGRRQQVNFYEMKQDGFKPDDNQVQVQSFDRKPTRPTFGKLK